MAGMELPELRGLKLLDFLLPPGLFERLLFTAAEALDLANFVPPLLSSGDLSLLHIWI
jgi:hypothetical protein